MYGGVVVHDIQSLSMMPSLGALIGNTHSSEVLDRLNMASGGGVIFGQPGDPYMDRYNALHNVLMNNLSIADHAVMQTHAVVNAPERYVPITSKEALYDIPKCMQIPIVTYGPVRTLLEAERIDGFGIDPRFLPDEDVYGRLIHNGRTDTWNNETEVTWHWKTDDPKVSDEDLNAIKETRDFIDQWLVDQMKPGGDYIDPTDVENTISKAKSKEED